MKFSPAVLAFSFLLMSGAASGKGVSIDPGLWEMSVTVEMPMLPQPQTEVSTECIEESELSPEDFNKDDDMPCEIANIQYDGNSASWSINCPNPAGGSMTGDWEFTSHGSTIDGSGTISMDMAGQQMAMNMTWKGKRTGPCQ